MIDPVHRGSTGGAEGAKGPDPLKADQIKMPKGMENIRPSGVVPKGVDLKGKETSEITGSHKAHHASRREFSLMQMRGTVSATPPQADDELDAIAEQFTKKTEHKLSGPRVKDSGKKGKKAFKWTASDRAPNLNPGITSAAMNRLQNMR